MKRHYKVTVMSGMEYMTTSFWDAFKMWAFVLGVDALLLLLKVLLSPTFWLAVLFIAAAYFMRGM